MSEEGFSPLRKEDPQAVSDLIRLLEKTARRPEQDSSDVVRLSKTVKAVMALLVEQTSSGWDVIRPKTYRERIPLDERYSDS